MTVIHLQLDIDSEVHPELHDTLCQIGSSRSQAERLRQLAATGLVWERLRLQAYGRFEVPELVLPSAPERTAAAQTQVVPVVAAAPRDSAEPVDFVDLSDAAGLATAHSQVPRAADVLAVDAADEQDIDRALQAAATRLLPAGGAPEPLPLHEIRSAVQALPVLTEVVAAAELPNMDAVAVGASAHDAHEQATAAYAGRAGAQIHELAPARKNATRSRLLRMKDKGLFKNE